MGEEPESEQEGSPLPTLPKKRDARQSAIMSFFLKTPAKKGHEVTKTSRGKSKLGRKEQTEKGNMRTTEEREVSDEKEEHTPLSKRIVTQKQDMRQLMRRKSTKATPNSTTMKTIMESTSVLDADSKKKSVQTTSETVQSDPRQ